MEQKFWGKIISRLAVLSVTIILAGVDGCPPVKYYFEVDASRPLGVKVKQFWKTAEMGPLQSMYTDEFSFKGKGVSKFDGASFRTCSRKQNDCAPSSQDFINADTVLAIEEYAPDDLWFGTYFGGVNRLLNGQWKHYTTKSTGIYGATGIGSTAVFKRIDPNTGEECQPDQYGCICVLEDTGANFPRGALKGYYLEYSHHHFVIDDNDLHKIYINPIDGEYCPQDFPMGEYSGYLVLSGLGSDKVNAILKDSKGNLWFGTGGLETYAGFYWYYLQRLKSFYQNGFEGGVSLFNPDTNTFKNFTMRSTIEENKGNNCNTKIIGESGLGSNTIISIAEDKDGNIWFGPGKVLGAEQAASAGFISRITKDGCWEYFTETPINGVVTSIAVDTNGDIYFTTMPHMPIPGYYSSPKIAYGVFMLPYGKNPAIKENWITYNIDNSNILSDTIFASGVIAPRLPRIPVPLRGIKIFGTTRGLSMLLPDNQTFRNFMSNYSRGEYIGGGNSNLPDNFVYSIKVVSPKEIYLGTYGGVCKFIFGRCVQIYKAPYQLPDGKVAAIEEDSKGNLWFGTGQIFSEGGQKNSYNLLREIEQGSTYKSLNAVSLIYTFSDNFPEIIQCKRFFPEVFPFCINSISSLPLIENLDMALDEILGMGAIPILGFVDLDIWFSSFLGLTKPYSECAEKLPRKVVPNDFCNHFVNSDDDNAFYRGPYYDFTKCRLVDPDGLLDKFVEHFYSVITHLINKFGIDVVNKMVIFPYFIPDSIGPRDVYTLLKLYERIAIRLLPLKAIGLDIKLGGPSVADTVYAGKFVYNILEYNRNNPYKIPLNFILMSYELMRSICTQATVNSISPNLLREEGDNLNYILLGFDPLAMEPQEVSVEYRNRSWAASWFISQVDGLLSPPFKEDTTGVLKKCPKGYEPQAGALFCFYGDYRIPDFVTLIIDSHSLWGSFPPNSGLTTTIGSEVVVKRPFFNAFEALMPVRGELVSLIAYRVDENGNPIYDSPLNYGDEAHGFAVKDTDESIYVFLYHYDGLDSTIGGRRSKEFSFTFKGKVIGQSFSPGEYQKRFYGISDNDLVGSVYNKWFELGIPENPTEAEVAELLKADDLKIIEDETFLHCPRCGDNMQDLELNSLGTTNAVGILMVMKRTGDCPPGCE